MSSSFLSAAERERWQRFPETIPQDDLAVYFLLSEDDEREVNRQREPFNPAIPGQPHALLDSTRKAPVL